MDEKFIINLGRQFASGGKDIAVRLSQILGVKVYDRELITEAAHESGVGREFFERSDEKSLWLKFFGFNGGTKVSVPLYGNAEYGNFINQDELFKLQSDVIRQIAARESCIFVGRCADYILRDNPRAVDVFVSADRQARIARICKNLNLSESKAEALMEQTDRERSNYYNYYTFKTWGAAASYDLCVNSTRLGIDATAEYIACFVRKVLG
jgi:hypothetical protein